MIRLTKTVVNNALIERDKIVYALEAAWYAMEKHAPDLCRREINTARVVLENYGRLPKSPNEPNSPTNSDQFVS